MNTDRNLPAWFGWRPERRETAPPGADATAPKRFNADGGIPIECNCRQIRLVIRGDGSGEPLFPALFRPAAGHIAGSQTEPGREPHRPDDRATPSNPDDLRVPIRDHHRS
ncbi:hypothetical protein GCM10011608_29340 [Micromonospora sonchi]|uniref:Uncharacterized protein n=1 Tax=Micromonospora sonchi TaxID=1763543 RepID=A0A917TYN2_9ACTN|nr:hypothetical protein GCM10011608_29340 [Micromonospora sonchi]